MEVVTIDEQSERYISVLLF